ncbi:MAG: NADH-quinone oxidoreductase subunit N, partial [Albidovulum sp.]|nr:NADH-quinone oxidoreductase subunit N [Albidovulum sp.]
MSAFSETYSAAALPEIILAAYAMAALMWGVFSKREGADSGVFWATALVLLGLGAWLAVAPPGSRSAFGGLFVDDGISRFAKVLMLVSSALVLLLSHDFFRRERQLKYEFPVLIAFSVVGMMTMVSAGDLMAMYMGIELQSLSLYVLAAFHRDSARSSEAGLKYFVLGALSSGLLLYGASLAYGYAGTTNFAGISYAIETGGVSLGMLFALAFMAAGLAFKVSAAPFHMWTPDVYEGSPTPATAFFATAPKVAAIVLFARLVLEAFGEASSEWRQILVFLSVASMFIGAIAAIGQRDIKRLMA